MNVAAGENKIGNAYAKRAYRARDANDPDRYMTNLELALPHLREAARIYRVNNISITADKARRRVALVEESIRQVGVVRAIVAATRG